MPRLRLTVLGLVTLGLLVGTPSAFAHATDPPELLGKTSVAHACVSARGGMVQLVDATTGACRFGATAQHWGVVGQPGTPGFNATASMVLTAGLCDPLSGTEAFTNVRPFRPGSCGVAPLLIPRAGVLSDWRAFAIPGSPQNGAVNLRYIVNAGTEQDICSMTARENKCSSLDTTVSVQAGDSFLLVAELVSPDTFSLTDLTLTFILTPAAAP